MQQARAVRYVALPVRWMRVSFRLFLLQRPQKKNGRNRIYGGFGGMCRAVVVSRCLIVHGTVACWSNVFIEGFCSERDWLRAYSEINDFEHELSAAGAIVIKFWLQISQAEQLKRFKITAEDWRNREKWQQY